MEVPGSPNYDPSAAQTKGVANCRTEDMSQICDMAVKEAKKALGVSDDAFEAEGNSNWCGGKPCNQVSEQGFMPAEPSGPGWTPIEDRRRSANGNAAGAGGAAVGDVLQQELLGRRRDPRSTSDGCIVKQVRGRSDCDPAVELNINTDEPDSMIEKTMYWVGTYPGGQNIVPPSVLTGESEVISIVLPAFAAKGGRALFFTTESVNTEGSPATGKCSIPSYDVTPPQIAVSSNVRFQSDTTSLTGTYTVTDDTPLVRLQYSVCRSAKSTAAGVVSWKDLPIVAPSSENTDGSTGDPEENFKEQKLQYLYYFEGGPATQTTGGTRGTCALACILFASGVGCKGFDWSASTKHCILHSDLNNAKATQLIKYEDYSHSVRADKTLSQTHNGKIKIMDLALEHNTDYFINVRARNAVGFQAIESSPAIHVDLTPPEPGGIANQTVDTMFADRCKAAKSQRCLKVTSQPNHRVIVDGVGSATVFNGHVPIYDDWYTRYNTFMVGNWDGFHDEESDLWQILFGVGTKTCADDVYPWGDPHSHLNGKDDWNHQAMAYPIDVEDGNYYLTSKVLNTPVLGGSFVTTVCHSQQYVVDTTAPLLYDVDKVKYNEYTEVAGIQYNTTDDLSHIRELQFGLGRTRHDISFRDWDHHCVGEKLPDGHCDRTHSRIFSPVLTRLAVNIADTDGGNGPPEGVYIWVRLASRNNVGLKALDGASKPFIIDTSPPEPGYVNDGPYVRHDLYWEDAVTTLAINFDKFQDLQSGIGRYDFCLGTAFGECNVIPFTWMRREEMVDHHMSTVLHGGAYTFKIANLSHNLTYFTMVKAYNNGHRIMTCNASSDGVRIDTTAPVAGNITDGATPLEDDEWTGSGHIVRAYWLNFTDPESDVVDYLIDVGTKDKYDAFMSKRTIGCGDGSGFFDHMPSIRCLKEAFNRKDFSIPQGTTYYITVEAWNGAHLLSHAVSNGITVDMTPPELIFLGDGSTQGEDRQFSSDPANFSANWGFEDPESGTGSVEWSLHERITPTKSIPVKLYDVQGALPGNSTGDTMHGLKLETGASYFAKVMPTNLARDAKVYTSDGLMLDMTPPKVLAIKIGSLDPFAPEEIDTCVEGNDLKCDQNIDKVVYWAGEESIQANWAARDSESGVAAYIINVVKFIDGKKGELVKKIEMKLKGTPKANAKTTGTLEAAFELYKDYQLCIIAIDGADALSPEVCSTPFHILKADVIGDAFDGAVAGEQSGFQTSKTHLTAAFRGFASELCGLVSHAWAVGTTPFGTDIMPFTASGIALSDTDAGAGTCQSTFDLRDGIVYHVTVRVTTGCGNPLETTTAGIMVDTTAPELLFAEAGWFGAEQPGFQEETKSIAAKWLGADADSGIDGYEFWIGPAPGVEGEAVAKTRLAASVVQYDPITVDPAMGNGTANLVQIVVRNRAGLESRPGFSNSVTADTSAPIKADIHCPQGIRQHEAFSCSWGRFEDAQAPLFTYNARISTYNGVGDDDGMVRSDELRSPLQRAALFDPAGTDDSGFLASESVQLRLLATNKAGLTTLAFSPVVSVDTSPPDAGEVTEESDIVGDVAGDIDCQISRTQVFARWTNWVDEESGIDYYEVGLGTSPGLDDVKQFVNVGADLAVVLTDFDTVLVGAEHVFVVVRGYNGVGMHSAAFSNGVAILRHDHSAVVLDGLGIEDQQYSASATEASVQWEFKSPCPIVKYEWSILKYDNTVVQDFKTVCKEEEVVNDVAICITPDLESNYASNDGLRLDKGAGYYILVRSTDVLNNTRVVASDGFEILTAPPLPGSVFDGPAFGVDLDFQGPTTFLGASWEGFGGDTIEVEKYYVSFGTDRRYPKLRANTVGVASVPMGDRSVLFENLNLIPRAQKYYCTIVGEADNKQTATTVSDGIRVGYGDPILPGKATVKPYQNDPTSLQIGFENFRSSVDMLFYEVAISTGSKNLAVPLKEHSFDILGVTCLCINGVRRCPPGRDSGGGDRCIQAQETGGAGAKELLEVIQNIEYKWKAGAVLTRVPELNLTVGVDYYVFVKGTDRAYGTQVVQVGPIRLDMTPPVPGEVWIRSADGTTQTNTSIMFAGNPERVELEWSGNDPESGVESFDVAIMEQTDCETPTIPDGSLFITVGTASRMEFTGLALTDGAVYRAFVRTTNRVGDTVMATSPVFYLDASTPAGGTVKTSSEFSGWNYMYQYSTDRLDASWLQVLDPLRLLCTQLTFNFATLVRQIGLNLNDIATGAPVWSVYDSRKVLKGAHNSKGTSYSKAQLEHGPSGLSFEVARDFREEQLLSAGIYMQGHVNDGSRYSLEIQASPEPGLVFSAFIAQGDPEKEAHELPVHETSETFVNLVAAMDLRGVQNMCEDPYLVNETHALTCNNVGVAMAAACEVGDETVIILCETDCSSNSSSTALGRKIDLFYSQTGWHNGSSTLMNRADGATPGVVTQTSDGNVFIDTPLGPFGSQSSARAVCATEAETITLECPKWEVRLHNATVPRHSIEAELCASVDVVNCAYGCEQDDDYYTGGDVDGNGGDENSTMTGCELCSWCLEAARNPKCPLVDTTTTAPTTTTTTIYQDVAELAAAASASNTNGTISFEADENALAGIGFQLHHTKPDKDAPCSSHPKRTCQDTALCRFDRNTKSCLETHRLLLWVRYPADILEPKETWVDLNFDPSAGPHSYDLIFNEQISEDASSIWNAMFLIDDKEVLALYGIPELQVDGTPLSFIMHSWSSIPASRIPSGDPFNPWKGAAFVKSAVITPKPNAACRSGGAFHDTDSAIRFKAAVGSGPYRQDVVTLKDVHARGVSISDDATANAEAARAKAEGVEGGAGNVGAPELAPAIAVCKTLFCNSTLVDSFDYYTETMAASTTTTVTSTTTTGTATTTTRRRKTSTLTSTTTTDPNATNATNGSVSQDDKIGRAPAVLTEEQMYHAFVQATLALDHCACVAEMAPLPATNSSAVQTTLYTERRLRMDKETLEEERTDAARPCIHSCETPADDVRGGCVDPAAAAKHAETLAFHAHFKGLSLYPKLRRYVNQELRDTQVISDSIAGGVGGRTDMSEDEQYQLADEIKAIELLEHREAAMAETEEETELYPATYFVTVQAINPTGRLVAHATKGVTIDVTPPIFFDRTRPECVDPSNSNVKNADPCGADPVQYDAEWLDDQGEPSKMMTHFQGNNHTVSVKYKAVDLESPIRKYFVTVLEGDHTLIPSVDVGTAEDWNATGLKLLTGTTYCVIVRAINAAGLWSDAPGQCITLDSHPPVMTNVWSEMKTGKDITPIAMAPEYIAPDIAKVVFSNNPEPEISYAVGGFGFGESGGSGIDDVEIAVGTRPRGCEVLGFMFASKGESVSVDLHSDDIHIERTEGPEPDGFVPVNDFKLNDKLLTDADVRFVAQPGQLYFFSVKVTSGAHLESTATGPALTVLGPATRTGMVVSTNVTANPVFDLSTDMGGPVHMPNCSDPAQHHRVVVLEDGGDATTDVGEGEVDADDAPIEIVFSGCVDSLRIEGLDHAWGWSQDVSTTSTTKTTSTATSTTSTTTVPCINQVPLFLTCTSTVITNVATSVGEGEAEADEEGEGGGEGEGFEITVRVTTTIVNVTGELFKTINLTYQDGNTTTTGWEDGVAELGMAMVANKTMNCSCIDERVPNPSVVWPEKEQRVHEVPPSNALVIGMLTYEDVTRDYYFNDQPDGCAGVSAPYIRNPLEIDDGIVSRRLVGRIKGYQNLSFYTSPLGHISLLGPVTLALDYDPEVYKAALIAMEAANAVRGSSNGSEGGGRRGRRALPDDANDKLVPIVAYYNQRTEQWHDVETSCPKTVVDTMTPIDAEIEGKLRLQVCETNPADFNAVVHDIVGCSCETFCAGDVCETRCQVGDGDGTVAPACPAAIVDPNVRFLSAETHFALFWGSNQLVNSAPAVEQVEMGGDENTIQTVQLNFTDAENDVAKFSFSVSETNANGIPGHLRITDDGLLTFKPAPYFNGQIELSYKVTEVILAEGMTPLSSETASLLITVHAVRSPPILLFVDTETGEVLHGLRDGYADIYTERIGEPLDPWVPSVALGTATEMPLRFTAILIDVDSATASGDLTITTDFAESSYGNSSHLNSELAWSDGSTMPRGLTSGNAFMYGQRDAMCSNGGGNLDECEYPWDVLDRDYGIYDHTQWSIKSRTHTFSGSTPGVFEYTLLGWNEADLLFSTETLTYYFVACATSAYKPALNALGCFDFDFCDGKTTYSTENGTFFNNYECTAMTDCYDNATHYTLVAGTFYTDAICALYTSSTTTNTDTSTTSTTTTNGTVGMVAAPKKSIVGSILAPILVVLLIAGLVVAKQQHEKSEKEWENQIQIKQTELLWAMGSAWEIEEEELKTMGAAFKEQLPMCDVCGTRAMAAQIAARACCVFEMGEKSTWGDCVRFVPRQTSKFTFTNSDIHVRMTRSEAIGVLALYGTEPGDFFIQHVADGGKRRAGQLSVTIWAVGKIDVNAGEEKLDADGTNNTWVRTCNIIQQLETDGFEGGGDGEDTAFQKQYFKVDGQRINADTWNGFFKLLVDDVDSRIFDAAPSRFIPVAGSEHVNRSIEGGEFGETKQSKSMADVAEIVVARDTSKTINPKRMRGSLKKSAKGWKEKALASKAKRTAVQATWSFEKEKGYMTPSGEYFEPPTDEMPNVDWPPRHDARPPKLRSDRKPPPAADTGVGIKSKKNKFGLGDIVETSFPTITGSQHKKMQGGSLRRGSATAASGPSTPDTSTFSDFGFEPTPMQGSMGGGDDDATIQETSFLNATRWENDNDTGGGALAAGADGDDDHAYLNVTAEHQQPQVGAVQMLLRGATATTAFSSDRPISERVEGFGNPINESVCGTPMSESVNGFDDASYSSFDSDEEVAGFGNDRRESILSGFGNASEGEETDEEEGGENTGDVASVAAASTPKWKSVAGGRGSGGGIAKRSGSGISTSAMMLAVALSFSISLVGMVAGLTLDPGLVRSPTVIGSDLEEAAAKVAFLSFKRFGNSFDTLHKHYDVDDSGYLLLKEIEPMFVAAQIGSSPTRRSWAASFTQSFARSFSHGISLADLEHGFVRLGYLGTGTRCVSNTGAGFCPSLPADVTHRYLHVLEEDENVYAAAAGDPQDCAECTQANAMDSVRWPYLPFTAKEEDKYALHSIFDELEQGCDIFAFEFCMMEEDSSCAACSKEHECLYREALFRVAGGRFTGAPMLVVPHLFPGLQQMDKYAKECNVLLNVQSSLQYEVETSATKASVVGEAVRIVIEDGSGLCDADCIANIDVRSEAVSCFLSMVEQDKIVKWAGHHLENADDAFDETLFEAYLDCRGADDGEKCADRAEEHQKPTSKGATTQNIFSTFHDFNCARVVSIGPATKLKVANINVGHANCDPDASLFAQSTDSVAIFPSGLRTAIKSWALQPFGIEEYSTPYGHDETAPLIDAKEYADGRFSNALPVAAMLSGAVCNADHQITVTINGRTQVRNRLLRISTTLVKGLERLMTSAFQKVGIVRGYQTKSEALARGETNQWYRTGSAARVAFTETDAQIRNIDLAAEAIRAFHPVVRQAGMCLGLGLYVDGVHIDVRPPSSSAAATSIHAWAAGGAGMTSAEFKAWAEKLFGRTPLKMPDDLCTTPPVDVPYKQRQIFGGVAVAGAPRSGGSGGGDWCSKAEGALGTHFDEVWALVTTRYDTLEMANRRSLAEVESALRWCLQSCDGGNLEAPPPGSIAANKIKACNQALHWLPFGIGSPRGVCSLVTASSPVKPTACFWGSCVEGTELYGLMGPDATFQPALPTTSAQDPKCGADEALYGASNPSPMQEQLRALYAGHCSGRVMVFVDSAKELIALEPALKTLLVYNTDVVFVDVRISGPAYNAVIKAMDRMVNAWKPTVCKFYTEREFLAPYTMVKIGSTEIKSAIPSSL